MANQVVRYVALAYLGALPLTAHLLSGIDSHNLARIGQVLVLTLCAASLAYGAATRVWVGPDRLTAQQFAALALLSVTALSSAAQAPITYQAAREICLGLGLVGVALVFAQNKPQSDDARVLLMATVTASAAYASLVLPLAIAWQLEGSSANASDVFIGYTNHRFFSHVQTVVLPILGLATTSSISRRFRHLAWFGLTTGFALVILGGGRATALSLIAGSAAACFVNGPPARRLVANLLLGAVAGLVLVALIRVAIALCGAGEAVASSAADLDQLKSDRGRLYLWQVAWLHIRESPWFGIGPMHFAHFPNVRAAHPHNFYMQVAAEFGVPFALVVAAWGLWALTRFSIAIRACDGWEERLIGIALFLACFGAAVDAFFSGNLVMPLSQMWIAVLVGWSIAWCRSVSPSPSPAPLLRASGRRALALAGVLLVSQIWLVWSVYPEASRLSEHLEEAAKRVSNPRTNPRFWSHGWF